MLKNAPVGSDCVECSLETSVVVPDLVSPLLFYPFREAAPSLTRGMGNDGVGAVIQSGITDLVPRIDVGQAEVCPIRFNVQRGDHFASMSGGPGGNCFIFDSIRCRNCNNSSSDSSGRITANCSVLLKLICIDCGR